MGIRSVSMLVLAAVLAAASPAALHAQGTARSQDIDTSIRAAGMGGAGAAVWWGEPGVWGNPATLAEVRGLNWVEGRTQLVPDLASDVFFRSRRFLIGGAGVGVSLMGEPLEGLGRTRLDYGTDEGTDPFGNPTGTFSSYEQIEGWGVGISPLHLLSAIRDLQHGGEPASVRWVDVSFGLQRKHTVVVLAPSSSLGAAEADCVDWGVQGRFSPLRLLAPDAPVQLDLSGGFAILNANDARFDFGGEVAPASRIRRTGFAARVAVPWMGSEGAGAWGWWRTGMPNLFEVGFAIDSENITGGGQGPGYDVQRFGLEMTTLGILSGRVGHVTDRVGDIVDNTYGFGVRLPLGHWASVGYDYASIPEATGLRDVTRQGWSASLDPVQIWRDVQEAP